MECAALVRAIKHGDLDRLIIPDAPIDVLAQQIVAACSAEEWDEDAMFALARRAYPYRNLTRETFDSILGNVIGGDSGEARAVQGVCASRPGEWEIAGPAWGAAGGHHQRWGDS